ncbi:AraC family transcriptional regulator [Rhodococcus sp. T7]|uniref:AraC family transcriptional regulator n=1 Tax=Rhodococcus sp. T7 TaxID=627444 RepID=UPI001358747D|nr:AraC family transcriptional regulator [Rhodococcus sp. T7]KAF0962736.1 HTH-type transcriptional activator RhaS [Rhodococcus sp. T7]
MADHNLRAAEEFRSTDRDEAQSHISAVFSPHVLDVIDKSCELNVRLSTTVLPTITLGYLRHGAEVVIQPGRLGSYFHVNIPISGHTRSTCGDEEIVTGENVAAVLLPTESSAMLWSRDCEQLAVKINRTAVEDRLAQVLGHPMDAPLRFDLAMNLTAGPAKSWVRTVRSLLDALQEDPTLLEQPLITAHFENLIVSQLLHAQPHNYSEQLITTHALARPRTIKRVTDLIDASPEQPHTAAELAHAAGVSLRTLQDSFQDQLGITPMAYLRQVRLARAHEDFATTDPSSGLSVRDIAYKWGFNHLPRFAAAYRERYGVPPSDTLRQA